jgi:UDP-N-acetylmuramoyl-tripeptide--D-alanyl-D-alanine ligase
VLNGDDDLLWGYDPGMRRIMYGLGGRNSFRAENVRAEGTQAVLCDIASDAGRFPVRIPAYGSHMAMAALPAAVIGRLLGVSDEEICRGILTYEPVGSRANVYETGYITIIDDCYNANPNSVKAALTSLSALPGRRVAILGDMLGLGEQADELHGEIGAFAAQGGVDCLICCGDKAALIYGGYRDAGGVGASYSPSKADLIAALPGLIQEGDSVLIKASNGMKFDEVVPHLKSIKG